MLCQCGICGHCAEYTGQTMFVCADCQNKESEAEQALRTVAEEIYSLRHVNADPGLRGCLRVVFENHLKRYLPPVLRVQYDDEVAEAFLARART